MAIIIAIFALARAIIWAFETLEDLSETELRESKPTAITVSRIISERVTTRAKPRFVESRGDGIEGFNVRAFIGGFQGAIWRNWLSDLCFGGHFPAVGLGFDSRFGYRARGL
jgi:hypothetical protein